MVTFHGVPDINSEEGLKEKANRDDIKTFYHLYINVTQDTNILVCSTFSIMTSLDCWWRPSGGVSVAVLHTLEVTPLVPAVTEVVTIVTVGHAGLMTTAEGAETHDVITFVACQTFISSLNAAHSSHQKQGQEHNRLLQNSIAYTCKCHKSSFI